LPTDAGAASNTLLDDASRSLRLEQFNNTNNIGYTRYTVNDYTSTLNPNYGGYTILGFLKSNSSNNVEARQNNTTANINIGSNGQGIPLATMSRNLAADAGNYDCIEIIAFSALLNTAQIRILENYLSAKYGNIAIANDQYTMDNAGLDFDFEVAGIGRTTSAANSHSDAQSSIVRINGPSSLGNNDFLYFGHNGGRLNSFAIDVPSPVQARFERVWAVNEANEVGNVTVSFDLTGITPVTASDLRLLIDTDNDGIFNEGSTTILSGASQVGTTDVYQFSVTAATLEDSYRFTLGTTNASQTPLPVELVSFEARIVDDGVLLKWQTATENNNDHFTIERTKDGLLFEVLDLVRGSGNSQERNDYELIDSNPFQGKSYYRLSQTDYDGTTKYFPLVSVDVTPSAFDFKLYPNPTKGEFDVELEYASDGIETSLSVSDLQGREIFFVPLVAPNDKVKTIMHIVPPVGLLPGVYIVKLTHSQQQFTRRLVVE
jgi:hypothetical protein